MAGSRCPRLGVSNQGPMLVPKSIMTTSLPQEFASAVRPRRTRLASPRSPRCHRALSSLGSAVPSPGHPHPRVPSGARSASSSSIEPTAPTGTRTLGPPLAHVSRSSGAEIRGESWLRTACNTRGLNRRRQAGLACRRACVRVRHRRRCDSEHQQAAGLTMRLPFQFPATTKAHPQ